MTNWMKTVEDAFAEARGVDDPCCTTCTRKALTLLADEVERLRTIEQGDVMTTVYVVVHEDRHADVGVTVFAAADAAIAYAQSEARECARDPEYLEEELNDAMRADGWLYYCRYSVESDSIRVVERDIRDIDIPDARTPGA